MKMSAATFDRLAKKKPKYNNKKTVVDDIIFDSAAEAAYYVSLKDSKRMGHIKYFLRQVPFHLPGKVKYVCDFAVCGADGYISYVDVKGFLTAMFRLKKKQVEELYPVEIICVKRLGSSGFLFEQIEI